MQTAAASSRTQKKAGPRKEAGPKCNLIESTISWKNKKYSFTVCARDKTAAANKIVPALYVPDITADADSAVVIDCSSGEGCGDTQKCLPSDLACAIVKTRGPVCAPTGKGSCTAPEVEFACDIWVNVDAGRKCGCKVP